MANDFFVWLSNSNNDDAYTGTNYESSMNSDTQKISGFTAGQAASSKRMNSALRQSTLVTAALMDLVGGNTSYLNSKSSINTAMSNFFKSDIKISFSTASGQSYLSANDTISTLFGKIDKFLRDLKGAAYYNVSSVDVTTATNYIPTSSAVYKSIFTKVYKNISEISPSFTTSVTIWQLCKLMTTNSYLFGSVEQRFTNLHPTGADHGILEIMKKTSGCVIRFTDSTGKIFAATLDPSLTNEPSWSWIQLDITAPITFTEASTRTNIASGETIPTIFGKIKKWFSSLGSLAFKSSITNADVSSTAAISRSKLAGFGTISPNTLLYSNGGSNIQSLANVNPSGVADFSKTWTVIKYTGQHFSDVKLSVGTYEFMVICPVYNAAGMAAQSASMTIDGNVSQAYDILSTPVYIWNSQTGNYELRICRATDGSLKIQDRNGTDNWGQDITVWYRKIH